MKNTLLFLSIFWLLHANAQPVITSNNTLPAIGTVIPAKQSAFFNFNTPKGENVIWDFSALNWTNGGTFSIVKPSDAKDASSYPNANYVMKYAFPSSSLESFQFFKNSSTRLETHGISGTGVSPTFYIPPALTLPYPFNYLDSTTNTFSIGTISFTQTLRYDAYGTLKINGKSYTNVVRVHSHMTGLPDSYIWYNLSPLTQLLNQTVNDSILNFMDVPVNSNRMDGAENDAITIEPNPATEMLLFNHLGPHHYTLKIISMMGQELYRQNLNSTHNTVPINNLKTGPYIYELASEEGKYARGIFLKH